MAGRHQRCRTLTDGFDIVAARVADALRAWRTEMLIRDLDVDAIDAWEAEAIASFAACIAEQRIAILAELDG